MTGDLVEYAINKHRDTGHFYDKMIPYEFHLAMVEREVQNFTKIIGELQAEFKIAPSYYMLCSIMVQAAYGHDLIEDCRVTYNDLIASGFDKIAADIIYAVTNEKGKTRAERANEKYYQGIKDTPGATFIKVCDRIANVKYGLITKSSMVEKYRGEFEKFKENLYEDIYKPMFDYLWKLLNTEL